MARQWWSAAMAVADLTLVGAIGVLAVNAALWPPTALLLGAALAAHFAWCVRDARA